MVPKREVRYGENALCPTARLPNLSTKQDGLCSSFANGLILDKAVRAESAALVPKKGRIIERLETRVFDN